MAEAGLAEVPVVSDPLDVPPAAVRRPDAVLAIIDMVQAHGPTPVGGPDRYRLVVNVRGERAEAGAADRDARAAFPGGAVVGADGPLSEAHAAGVAVPPDARPPVAAAELPLPACRLAADLS